MEWIQKEVLLTARRRGIHLVTEEITGQVPEMARIRTGLAHIFLQHTSASLSINENVDPTVRVDIESHLNQLVPENAPYYIHTYEGSDDMPAHIKSVLLGPALVIPITTGRFNLGTWQGIYLNEHRDRGSRRRIIVTLVGDSGTESNS